MVNDGDELKAKVVSWTATPEEAKVIDGLSYETPDRWLVWRNLVNAVDYAESHNLRAIATVDGVVGDVHLRTQNDTGEFYVHVVHVLSDDSEVFLGDYNGISPDISHVDVVVTLDPRKG